MANVCTTCTHPEREAIDEALTQGLSMRRIAFRHGMSPNAIKRHRDRHLSPALAAVAAERKQAHERSLLERIEDLTNRAERILDQAEQSGKVSVALSAIREMRELLRLLGAATGELDDKPQVTVNLMASTEWLVLRAAILEALGGHPAARIAVMSRIAEITSGDAGHAVPPARRLPAVSVSQIAREGVEDGEWREQP